MNRNLRLTRHVAWALLVQYVVASVNPACEAAPPNIVIVLADDLGYGDVQTLNADSTIPTPNLDRLAKQGLTFTDAHSPSAVCTPTRYGLLTGRYCWRIMRSGVLGGYSPPLLEPGRRTIANLLKQRGYQTHAIGKWHLGMELPMLDATVKGDVTKWQGDPGVRFDGVIADSPIHHGFDHYFGVTASLDMAPYVFVRDDRFTQLPTIQQPAVPFPHYVRAGPRAEDFVIDQVLDTLLQEAQQAINRMAPAAEPYFLYLPLTGPHKPTQPAARFRGNTALGEYGDFVHQVDWTVGQLLETIAQTGESDNTLVIFTSDNGSYMYRYDDASTPDHVDDHSIQGFRAEHHRANGPLRGTKADIWEAGHRVPFFVRWPAELEANQRVHATICLTDIYATVAEIVGTELGPDEAEDSSSIAAALRGASYTRGAPVVHHSSAGMFAIRDQQWKLVCGTGSGGRQQPRGEIFGTPYQLYNLEEDIAETQDVAEQHPQIVAELTAKLETIRESGRSFER
ncbi:MAG: arylsulfatase [Planctomycetales bacterium]|nr:arylsulfatase [Planctomycetales bacterium]